MKSRWPRRLGTRLTISYILLLICTLIVFTIGTAAVLFVQMKTQLEHFAVQDIETVKGLMSFAPDGGPRVREDYHNHPESRQVLEHFLEVRAPDGPCCIGMTGSEIVRWAEPRFPTKA
jgi:hypothetical protein